MKCNSDWTVTQHVENMCMIQDELTAVNASVRGPLFTQMIIRSLRANSRFDRLIGMVEIGDDKFETPDKLKEQRRRKHLERGITKKNQVVYLDLLYPKYSASLKPYKTVLVVVGEYSRLEGETIQDTGAGADNQSVSEFCDADRGDLVNPSLEDWSQTSDNSSSENEETDDPQIGPSKGYDACEIDCNLQDAVHDDEAKSGTEVTVLPRDGETTRDFNPDLMATCMNSEIITGERRKALDADLEDVQEMKRRRYSEGRPQKMVLRQTTERRYFLWRKGYLVNAAIQENGQIITMERKWRANETKVPRSFTEAMKTPQKTNGMLVWKKR
ncbi:unnamed protein product [Peronospora belbahrii]|uniref:Uncharacterized protein n=1 Tax=Peronospora belbahrii TaxID=622444 RepID=A0AAU9KRC6_9STRA|nr:unnamed protein product [Peronospora belbahrii]